jgi:phosphatidylglycerophosphate synthase
VARETNTSSAFGGYLDILCDFIIYAVVPVGIVWGQESIDPWVGVSCSRVRVWVILSLLMGTYFVNAASLFMLSALIEARGNGKAKTKEKTSVTMPAGLIEGTVSLSLCLYIYIYMCMFVRMCVFCAGDPTTVRPFPPPHPSILPHVIPCIVGDCVCIHSLSGVPIACRSAFWVVWNGCVYNYCTTRVVGLAILVRQVIKMSSRQRERESHIAIMLGGRLVAASAALRVRTCPLPPRGTLRHPYTYAYMCMYM